MLWTVELTPSQKHRLEQAVQKQAIAALKDAHQFTEPTMKRFAQHRYDEAMELLKAVREAEVA